MLENHNQYGRSMLEMLGVLAVVGILSVIGIKSFQYAMERYRLMNWRKSISALFRTCCLMKRILLRLKKQNLLKKPYIWCLISER